MLQTFHRPRRISLSSDSIWGAAGRSKVQAREQGRDKGTQRRRGRERQKENLRQAEDQDTTNQRSAIYSNKAGIPERQNRPRTGKRGRGTCLSGDTGSGEGSRYRPPNFMLHLGSCQPQLLVTHGSWVPGVSRSSSCQWSHQPLCQFADWLG